MRAMTMTNTAAFNKGTEDRRLSLKERFENYIREYGVQIACGLMALNGDSNAYKYYAEMTGRR